MSTARIEAMKRRLEAEYPVRSLDRRAKEIAERDSIPLVPDAYKRAIDEEVGRLRG